MTQFKDIIFEKNVAIHCPEEWMANELLKYADSKGYKWSSGCKYTDDNGWNAYKCDTVYIIKRGTYSGIESAKDNDRKILHYNDVAIKEGEIMKTKLDYELIIKGRKADIGSELWKKNGSKIEIIGIDIDKEDEVRIMYSIKGTMDLEYIGLSHIDNILFWEKPITYQLPDTEGNLSEVKIGQHVWLRYENDSVYKCVISEFSGSDIEIMFIYDNMKVYVSNKKGLTLAGAKATTNKPSRFHGKQDWSQAPENAMWWAIDDNGYAYWFEEKPKPGYCVWTVPNTYDKIAGYRNDLIDDRENMRVTDWKESLVMRPKGGVK